MKKDIVLTVEFGKLASDDMSSFIRNNLSISNEEVKLYTVGIGAWTECYDSIKDFTKESESFMKKCDLDKNGNSNCADNGIHLPSVLKLDQKEFYGFSEFWYTMEDILKMGGKFIADKFKQEAKVIILCIFQIFIEFNQIIIKYDIDR